MVEKKFKQEGNRLVEVREDSEKEPSPMELETLEGLAVEDQKLMGEWATAPP